MTSPLPPLPGWITPDIAVALEAAMLDHLLGPAGDTPCDWEEWVWLHPACPAIADGGADTPPAEIAAVAHWVQLVWREVVASLDPADRPRVDRY